ncbi:MAG: methyltransferase [Desulfobacterales bacterium]
MDVLPEFQIGILNGWVPLAIYLIGFILSVSLYSKEKRIWLFNNPKNVCKGVLMLLRLFGQLAMVAYIVMMIFTPLKIHHPLFFVGAGVFSIGFVLEMSALNHFRRAPVNEPVVKGPYRISRNPQWVGLFLVLLGSAATTAIWLYLGIVVVVAVIYHMQILDEETACIEKYGESYREYMNRVPRYFLVL